ncbi:MAG: tetratricopeptide repeat protein [Cyanosarcina radialis HA8281-LM2]|nr:tetratricopeptide repeat protein [Cyanosarcina radialis HA8281-LM2]
MNPESSDWTKDVIVSPEQEYKALLRSLQRARGFNLLFAQCSPAEGERLIQRVEKDLPDKQIEVLSLKEQITNLYELVDALSRKNQIDILFIQGLEYSLYDYEKSRLWQNPKERYSYSERSVPPVLARLNLDREKFYDRFKFSFVFLVPLFALKYLIRRAPDFFDWRSGVFEFAMDSERFQQESLQAIQERSLREDYSTLNRDEYRDLFLKVQALIEEPYQTNNQKARLFFEQACLSEIAEDWEAALASYDRLLALEPNNSDAWNLRGAVLYQLERYEEAISSFDQALALEPNNSDAWNLQGMALYKLEHYEEAISSFSQALVLVPDSAADWHLRGMALYKLERYEEAISSFGQVLALQANDFPARYHRAKCYALWGKVDEAIKNLQQAIALRAKYRKKANTDPDFDTIRDDDRFQKLVGDFVKSERSLEEDGFTVL